MVNFLAFSLRYVLLHILLYFYVLVNCLAQHLCFASLLCFLAHFSASFSIFTSISSLFLLALLHCSTSSLYFISTPPCSPSLLEFFNVLLHQDEAAEGADSLEEAGVE
jgi:hypothetical protein